MLVIMLPSSVLILVVGVVVVLLFDVCAFRRVRRLRLSVVIFKNLNLLLFVILGLQINNRSSTRSTKEIVM
jgi:hypothetical protein